MSSGYTGGGETIKSCVIWALPSVLEYIFLSFFEKIKKLKKKTIPKEMDSIILSKAGQNELKLPSISEFDL